MQQTSALCSPFGQAVTEVKKQQSIPSTGKDQRAELETSPATTQTWTRDRTVQYSFSYRDIRGEILLSVCSTSDVHLNDVQVGFFRELKLHKIYVKQN